MPRLLIVAATPFEIEPLAKHFAMSVPGREILCSNEYNTLSILITGVGMVNTAYCMGRCLDTNFDFVINAGICGAFHKSLPLGEVVHVVSDTLSEMGAENDTDFITYPDLGLGGTNTYSNKGLEKTDLLTKLRQVKGITVNKVHGNEVSIKKTIAHFNPDIESMEGAAFFRGCAHFRGTCVQVRSVSNYVEKRDKSKWNIPLAISNLNSFLIQFINDLHV